MPVRAGRAYHRGAGPVRGTTRVHTTCEENTLDEDETDGDLSLIEELTADIGPL